MLLQAIRSQLSLYIMIQKAVICIAVTCHRAAANRSVRKQKRDINKFILEKAMKAQRGVDV